MSSLAWTRGGNANVCFRGSDKGWCTPKYVNSAWSYDIMGKSSINTYYNISRDFWGSGFGAWTQTRYDQDVSSL